MFTIQKNSKKQKNDEGITLLLVVLILSAIFSVSLSIFTITFEELRISGEISDSFVSLFAADEGIERLLYVDRVINRDRESGICDAINPTNPECFVIGQTPETMVPVASGACYGARISKFITGDTAMRVVGQFRCGESIARVVLRGFMVAY